jgi:hypothetical protein
MASRNNSWRTPAIMALISSHLVGCASEPLDTPQEEIAQIAQALTPSQPTRRPTIQELSPSERQTLANAIITFVTPSVLTEHSNGHDWHHPSVGELFFIRHHDYLNQLENYLLSNGLARFVPVPEWDPGTPIPPEFLVADPLVSQAPMNQTPNRPVPAQFADSQLCNFASTSALAVAIEPWHDSVHGAVGGAMGSVAQAPGAPIFWLWHGLLDDTYHERTWRCETLPAIIVALG